MACSVFIVHVLQSLCVLNTYAVSINEMREKWEREWEKKGGRREIERKGRREEREKRGERE